MSLSRFFAPSSALEISNNQALLSKELGLKIKIADIIDTINVPTKEGYDGYIGIQYKHGVLCIDYKKDWEKEYKKFYKQLKISIKKFKKKIK